MTVAVRRPYIRWRHALVASLISRRHEAPAAPRPGAFAFIRRRASQWPLLLPRASSAALTFTTLPVSLAALSCDGARDLNDLCIRRARHVLGGLRCRTVARSLGSFCFYKAARLVGFCDAVRVPGGVCPRNAAGQVPAGV